jgi:hypothetical protein
VTGSMYLERPLQLEPLLAVTRGHMVNNRKRQMEKIHVKAEFYARLVAGRVWGIATIGFEGHGCKFIRRQLINVQFPPVQSAVSALRITATSIHPTHHDYVLQTPRLSCHGLRCHKQCRRICHTDSQGSWPWLRAYSSAGPNTRKPVCPGRPAMLQ